VFAQSREDVRLTFCSVYQKMQETMALDLLESQIAAVIAEHPEYHALLEDKNRAMTSEFTPEGGQSNPFLHMGMHLAIREQVATNRPAGIFEHYQQLAGKVGVSDAEHRMMECLGRSLWEAQQNNSLPNEAAYLLCIQKIL